MHYSASHLGTNSRGVAPNPNGDYDRQLAVCDFTSRAHECSLSRIMTPVGNIPFLGIYSEAHVWDQVRNFDDLLEAVYVEQYTDEKHTILIISSWICRLWYKCIYIYMHNLAIFPWHIPLWKIIFSSHCIYHKL